MMVALSVTSVKLTLLFLYLGSPISLGSDVGINENKPNKSSNSISSILSK